MAFFLDEATKRLPSMQAHSFLPLQASLVASVYIWLTKYAGKARRGKHVPRLISYIRMPI